MMSKDFSSYRRGGSTTPEKDSSSFFTRIGIKSPPNRGECSTDDTEVIFQLPAKKLKQDNATKPFPSYESHFELIQLKTEAAKQHNKISSLEKELVELRTTFDKERSTLTREKSKLESRLNDVEREMRFVTEKENEREREIEKLSMLLQREKLTSQEKLRNSSEQKSQLEERLSEKIVELESRLQSLWMELSKERNASTEQRNNLEEVESELEHQAAINERLTNELKMYIERLASTSKERDEAKITLKEFREENQIATALRYDTTELKDLRLENTNLKQQNQRMRNLSENTALLREKNASLELELAKHKRSLDVLVNENNELKIAIAKSSQTSSAEKSLFDIDMMTKRCMELKKEVYEKNEKIVCLEEKLQASEVALAQFIEKDHKMEVTLPTCSTRNVSTTNSILVQTDEFSLGPILSTTSAGPSVPDIEHLLSIVREKDERICVLMRQLGIVPDYDPATTKIVHLQMNPLSEANSLYVNELSDLRQENATLKVRVGELEKFREAAVAGTSKVEDDNLTVNVWKQLEEHKSERIIDELRAEVVKLTEQRERVAKINQEIGAQFREMCTMLLGYQIKMKEAGLCIVQSTFEKHDTDAERFFLFKRGTDGSVQLLDNDYASEWRDFIEMYLVTDNSIPAFLAAATLQLFSKFRDSMVVSTSSTTLMEDK